MSGEALRFGVLGCADIARRRTLPALAGVPGATLVAVASRDTAKAKRYAAEFGCAVADGYDELLGRGDIDAVYLPLPAGLHAMWAERALLVGKHVLVEKPLTTAHAESVRLFKLARAGELVLMENMTFPHHGQHDRVRRLVADGTIGELRAFSAVFAVPPRPPGDIRLLAELGGGALLDQGVYPLRAAAYHIDAPLEVLGAVLRYPRMSNVDTSGSVLLLAGGVTVQLEFGMDGTYRAGYELTGSTGRIRVPMAFTPPPEHVPELVLERADGRETLRLPAEAQFANTIRSFCAAVRARRFDAYAEPALRVARLVDTVRAVARRVDG